MPNSNHDKKQLTVPGTASQVIIVHQGGIQSFFLKLLRFIGILLFLLIVYFIGVIAGTSGWHLRTVDQFSNWWPNSEELIWSKIRSLDQDAERHAGNTVKALNERMDDLFNGQQEHMNILYGLWDSIDPNTKVTKHCESVNKTLNLIIEQSIIQTKACKYYNQQEQKRIETISQSSNDNDTSQDIKETTKSTPESSTP